MAVIDRNLGLAALETVSGRRIDPYQSNNFVIEIEGLLVGGFAGCTGLQVEVKVHEYREGGENEFVHQFAGAVHHPPLVLKHGMSSLDGLWDWHQDVVVGKIKRRNATIYLLDQARVPVVSWNVREALPIKWTGPALGADSAAVAFETIELTHRGLVRASGARDVGQLGASIAGTVARLTRGFF